MTVANILPVIDCRAIVIICLVLKHMASNIRIVFGKRIRTLRLARDLSQERLADAVGLHRTYIGNIERGEESVSVDNVAKIAKALKVSISELFKGL